MVEKTKNEVFVLPEARVLVVNLLERDVYKDKDTGAEGKPKYKVVVAFDPASVTGEGTIEDDMADAIAAAYGDQTADEWLASPRRADRISPLKDGNEIAKEREAALERVPNQKCTRSWRQSPNENLSQHLFVRCGRLRPVGSKLLRHALTLF